MLNIILELLELSSINAFKSESSHATSWRWLKRKSEIGFPLSGDISAFSHLIMLTILGIHVSLTHLRNFAESIAPSLINVPSVCLFTRFKNFLASQGIV